MSALAGARVRPSSSDCSATLVLALALAIVLLLGLGTSGAQARFALGLQDDGFGPDGIERPRRRPRTARCARSTARTSGSRSSGRTSSGPTTHRSRRGLQPVQPTRLQLRLDAGRRRRPRGRRAPPEPDPRDRPRPRAGPRAPGRRRRTPARARGTRTRRCSPASCTRPRSATAAATQIRRILDPASRGSSTGSPGTSRTSRDSSARRIPSARTGRCSTAPTPSLKAVRSDNVVMLGGLAPGLAGPGVDPAAQFRGRRAVPAAGRLGVQARSGGCQRARFDASRSTRTASRRRPPSTRYKPGDMLVGDSARSGPCSRGGGQPYPLWVTEFSWFTNPPNAQVGDAPGDGGAVRGLVACTRCGRPERAS